MRSIRFVLHAMLLTVSAASVNAASITDYNVFVAEHFSAAVHVEGATHVGGNLTSIQMSEFNHKNLTHGNDVYGLEVGGTLSGDIKVMHGQDALYGTKGAGNIDCMRRSNCATSGADLSAKTQDLSAQMVALSQSYLGLAANADMDLYHNQVNLNYSGADGVAVFHLTATDLFFQNSGISLNAGSAEKVIINVSGDVNVTNTNLVGNWDFSNVLWNFYDATTLDFNYMAVKGTVLAPSAAVLNGAGFDGSLYAQSYTNNTLREFHGFFWTPDVPTASVPEPLSIMMMFSGLFALFMVRRRPTAKK